MTTRITPYSPKATQQPILTVEVSASGGTPTPSPSGYGNAYGLNYGAN